MKSHSTELPEVAVLEDTKDFAALEEEWEDLYQSSPLATPFQSWAWLYSWWELYRQDYELRLITVRDEGLLVGLVPLMLRHWRGLKWLLFVGTGETSYLDILAREGWEAQTAEAGAKALRRLTSWHLADLQQLRPEATAWSIFRQWTGPRAFFRQDNCLLIDAKPWDQLVASLPKSQRTPTRRTIRRLKEDGIRCQLANPADAERAARALVALSREQWRERWRETYPEFWSKTFESHMVVAARRMTACGLGGISEFWKDGQVVVSNFLLFGRDFVAAYWAGASKEALRRYSFNTLYIWDMANIARSRDCAYLNLLRGEEPYKLRWHPSKVSNHRIILSRNVAYFIPYVGYRALRSRVRRYIRSEDLPQWVRNAESEFCSLRSRVRWWANPTPIRGRANRSRLADGSPSGNESRLLGRAFQR